MFVGALNLVSFQFYAEHIVLALFSFSLTIVSCSVSYSYTTLCKCAYAIFEFGTFVWSLCAHKTKSMSNVKQLQK